MKKIIVLALLTALVSCAGRDAQLEMVSKPDDKRLSCHQIKNEQTVLMSKMQMTANAKSDSNVYNAAVGVGGLIFFPAWFFLDLKRADAKELRSQQARYNQLVSMALDKGCK